jgi:hypothetical protein
VKLTVNEQLQPKHAAVSGRPGPEDFKDDPLIQEALDMFNAQIKS